MNHSQGQGESPQPAPPLHLDYFAAAGPGHRRAGWVIVCTVLLLLSWAPYLCGIVNLVVARTGSDTGVATTSPPHERAAALLTAAALLLSAASLAGFIRLRQGTGIAASGAVLAAQLVVAACTSRV